MCACRGAAAGVLLRAGDQDWRIGSGKTERVRSIFLEQMFILKSHMQSPFEILLTLPYHSFDELFLIKSFFKQQHKFSNCLFPRYSLTVAHTPLSISR